MAAAHAAAAASDFPSLLLLHAAAAASDFPSAADLRAHSDVSLYSCMRAAIDQATACGYTQRKFHVDMHSNAVVTRYGELVKALLSDGFVVRDEVPQTGDHMASFVVDWASATVGIAAAVRRRATAYDRAVAVRARVVRELNAVRRTECPLPHLVPHVLIKFESETFMDDNPGLWALCTELPTAGYTVGRDSRTRKALRITW